MCNRTLSLEASRGSRGGQFLSEIDCRHHWNMWRDQWMFDILSLAEFEGPTRVPHELRLTPTCTHRCAVVPPNGSRVSSFLEEHDTRNTCCMMDKKTRDANDAAGAATMVPWCWENAGRFHPADRPIGAAPRSAARQPHWASFTGSCPTDCREEF